MGGWFDSDEVEVDIKVTHDPDNTSDLNVDVALVYFVKVENGERVKASIATAVASISGASSEKIEVAVRSTAARRTFRLPLGASPGPRLCCSARCSCGCSHTASLVLQHVFERRRWVNNR